MANLISPNLPEDITFPKGVTIDKTCEISRLYLDALRTTQRNNMSRDFDPEIWVTHYTHQIDTILIQLFTHFVDESQAALIAIGGYGRSELFPLSDIDILLLKRTTDALTEKSLEDYIQCLWSLGLDIAQSVRTPEEALTDAKEDSDTLTSLIESRYLAGNINLFYSIDVNHPPLISPLQFFADKLAEQKERNNKQADLGRLEPNIKTGNGGLRDIQMIGWLNHFCCGAEKSNDYHKLLSQDEIEQLIESRNYLWQIRFALHLNRRSQKDKLSFDQQKIIAEQFGFENGPNNQAVEQFMRSFYRALLNIRRLNRLVIKIIDAELHSENTLEELDEDFILINHCLALKDNEALEKRPELLWKIFLRLLDYPEIASISPQLARLLREKRDIIITDEFRRNEKANWLFLEILNHPGNVFRQLRRMHRYGILGRYITQFRHAEGLMQFDLFHQYTVDQHTLRLIYFLDQFKRLQPNYPLAEELMHKLRYPAILYLAALFHDLGKGLHGDHSILGVEIAEGYLKNNSAIDAHDGELLKFLIRNHLQLSVTAQKKDLSDLNVIANFAENLTDSEYLDYLYLLTLADISATNDTLWNSWRASLLSTLYRLTKNYMDFSAPSPEQQLVHLQQQALNQLAQNEKIVRELWQDLPYAFFLNETPQMIAAKTNAFLNNKDRDFAVHLRNHPPRFFISASTSPDILFARATHFLEKNNLNIVEARLYSDFNNKYAIQQFTLSDESVFDTNLLAQLNQTISANVVPKPLGKRLGERRLEFFKADTQVEFRQEFTHQRTVMEITCKDRHGLLSLISRVLLEHHIHLSHAKIATLGERAEDTFYLTDNKGRPITNEAALDAVKTQLIDLLQP